jgi:hypothetical protein
VGKSKKKTPSKPPSKWAKKPEEKLSKVEGAAVARRDGTVYQRMKLAFVEGLYRDGKRYEPNFVELSDIFSVPVSTIKRVARIGVPRYSIEGGWVEARDAFRKKLEKIAVKQRTKLAVLDIEEQDTKHLRQAHVIEDAAFLALMDTTRDGGRERLVVPPRFRKNLSASGVKALTDVWEKGIQTSRLLRGQAGTIMDMNVAGEVVVEHREELPEEIRALPDAVRRDFLSRMGNELARSQAKMREERDADDGVVVEVDP